MKGADKISIYIDVSNTQFLLSWQIETRTPNHMHFLLYLLTTHNYTLNYYL